MLSFFKSNNPAVIVLYLVYIAVFRMIFVFTHFDASFLAFNTEPLSALTYTALKPLLLSAPWVNPALAGLLCFIQALLVNDIVNENKMLAKKNYVGGLLFIIVSSFFPESLLLSPALLSLTFIILATRKMFSLIKKEKAFGDVFDVSFLIAIAGLFYFPAMLLLLFAYIGLGIMRAFNYRDWVITFMGFVSPLILVFTWYFWFDKLQQLPLQIANLHGNTWLNHLALKQQDYILMGALVFFTAIALALLPGALYSSLIQVRKYSTALITLLFLSILAFTMQQTTHLYHWVLLALPLGIIFSMVLMQIKSKPVSEVTYLILILLVLAGQYLPLLGIL